MKKIFLLTAITIFGMAAAFGQKYAFVDSEYILGNIPSYKAAKEKLDIISAEWQKEVEAQYAEIDKLYKDYQAEKVLLTEEMRSKREDAIIEKERSVKELQKKYFGQDGALFQKRQELIKPIQDEIYQAVKDIATENGYAVIFDTSSGPGMLYFNPKFDVSDDVLQKLGYKN
ncbi:MAG: OmpH family outer membrane protein [Bacteroidales bacterium]